jgi:hypothetical protein
MEAIKNAIPETPFIVAGACGGPCVMFTVTPFRNGLTLGASNIKAGAMELYGSVFARGFAGGWTGGIYPAIAACPQFLCLGPAFHFYAAFTGTAGGVVLTSLTESGIVFGAETCNAQMARNAQEPGTIKNVHNSMKPWGTGFSIHFARNLIATAGLRLLCQPCTWAIETATGKSNALTTLAGDFTGNVCAACVSAPVHQLYAFTVTTPELADLPSAEKRARAVQFLKDQYLVPGTSKLSPVVPRDLFMRSMYVAVAYTMYSTLERTLVAKWQRS